MFRKMIKACYFRPILKVLFIGFLFFSFASISGPKDSVAAICCTGCCNCYSDVMSADISGWISNWIMINVYIFIQLMIHRIIFFDWEFWQVELLPALMMTGEQLAAVGTQQVAMIGMFLDATEQLQTQRLMQEMKARAHKAYHPSIELCEFGTRVKSLAASERKGEINQLVLSSMSMKRMLNNAATAPTQVKGEIGSRLQHFKTELCNVYDNNGSLQSLCSSINDQSTLTPAAKARLNNDVDYAAALKDPFSVNVDFSDGTALTDREEDIIALGKNLYRYESIPIFDPHKIQNTANFSVNDFQKAYLRARAAVAKNSVAENSFNALIALKSDGTPGSQNFLAAYLEELGVDPGEVNDYIGVNPSYDTQMKLLTKTIYQTPKFYTNLYDKPENVKRKGVAMQAVGLMQKFDLFKSNLRTEASLSVLLELSIEKLQGEVIDSVKGAKGTKN